MKSKDERIESLMMKQAEEVGDLRRRIDAEQADLRKSCTHPEVEIKNRDYQDEKMYRPIYWREKRCKACNACLEKEITETRWVKTDFAGNELRGQRS